MVVSHTRTISHMIEADLAADCGELRSPEGSGALDTNRDRKKGRTGQDREALGSSPRHLDHFRSAFAELSAGHQGVPGRFFLSCRRWSSMIVSVSNGSCHTA